MCRPRDKNQERLPEPMLEDEYVPTQVSRGLYQTL